MQTYRLIVFQVRTGGIVPESYYLKDIIDTTQFESATVSAGCKLALKVPIDQPNCVIRYYLIVLLQHVIFTLTVSWLPTANI